MDLQQSASSNEDVRRAALEILQAGVDAAAPGDAVRRALRWSDSGVEIVVDPFDRDSKTRSADWKHVHVIAFGKAACSMGRAAEAILPPERFPGPGVVVTNYPNVTELDRFEVIGSGHPLPDENGVEGAGRIAAAARRAAHDELVLVLISGGGSAIVPAPTPDISLEDKIRTTDLLLGSGADIGELNTIRKHLSELKGGGLARLAAPADLHALILSDVIGDDLSTIASGQTVPDPTTFGDAVEILSRRGILDQVPPAVRERLEKGERGDIAETPKPGDPLFQRTGATLVGSNRLSLAATREKAAELVGAERVETLSEALCGEVQDEAKRYVDSFAEYARAARNRPFALLAGGETTVTLRGKGRGGRNQEMALTFAVLAERVGLEGRWAFLSGGTDGLDGPTDAAGGLVDRGTLERIRAAGKSPEAMLEDNDSYHALDAAGDLVVTGATGTNVADLQVALFLGD